MKTKFASAESLTQGFEPHKVSIMVTTPEALIGLHAIMTAMNTDHAHRLMLSYNTDAFKGDKAGMMPAIVSQLSDHLVQVLREVATKTGVDLRKP